MKKFKKMKKRILSALMISCMCITMLPQGVVTVSAADGTFSGGTGTVEDPYQISSVEDLEALADAVNDGNSYAGQYFKLTQDITLDGEWIPIGYSSDTDFWGVFDGDNHKIEGLTIMFSDQSFWEYCGLFGSIWEGTVQNLTVKGDINSTVLNTGGIVGRADDAKIINCSYEGTIISSSRDFVYIGGIAGGAYGTKIINCRNKGDIEGSADSRVGAGGIVGYASDESEIINCKNEGSVNAYAGSESLAGGIVGWTQMTVTITDCRNTGRISAQDSYAGGIVGLAQVVSGRGGMYSSDITTIANCLNENEVQDSPSWGEIVGEAKRDNGTDLITIKNCYYTSGSGEAVGRGTANVDTGNVEEKNEEEFASGEVAYLLQNSERVSFSDAPQDGLVWGQNLGVDNFPGLVYFMEGDKAAKEVLKITLYDANPTGYTPYETYINNGATIKAAVGFEQISSQGKYPAETYETVGLSGDGTGDIFRDDAPITEDNTVLYLFYKEKFSSEDDAIITPHGIVTEKDLDEQMKYAGDTSAAGNFTYEITDGNGNLGASLSDSTLTIPATADIGNYTLTIKATEKVLHMENLKDEVIVEHDKVPVENRDSVTFEVTVTVEKSDQDWIDEAKNIVQKALDEMNVTNETTKEDIQDVVEQALKEAGLEGVTATVGDNFSIEESTGDTKGKVTGTVTLEKGEEKGTVNFELEIPVDTGKGTVDKDTQSGEGAPEAELPMNEEELADAVLSDQDKQDIENGKNINLLLTVENTTNTVSATDKQKVEEGASYYTVGQYLDIKLIKMVDTDNPDEGTLITKTNAPIEIVIIIPNNLKKENRTYAVVRLHNEEATILEDLDDNPDTVTIETDRFSTYAMVYTEITDADRVTEAQKIVEKVLSDMTVTNDTTKEGIQQAIDAALKGAGFSDVTATVGALTKKDATGDAEGSIVGTVTIKKGEKSGSISINKTIAKLPQDNTGNQEQNSTVTPLPDNTDTPDSTVTPPDSTVITPEQQEKNEFALNEGLKVAQKGKKINVSWGKVTEADGYQIYIQYCGKKFSKPTKEVKSTGTTKVTVTKINGKKLNLKKNYKVYVVAYKLVNGKRVVLGKTITAHIVGQNNKAYTNVKQVKVSKSKYTLKVGKTAKIKAKTVLVDKKKKQLSDNHAKEFRYKSTDIGVAVVSAKGKITAKGKGTCYIYVYARNGYAKKVKVIVK